MSETLTYNYSSPSVFEKTDVGERPDRHLYA